MARGRPKGVRNKKNRGVPAHHDPALRRCLGGCDRMCWSLGPGLRICAACRLGRVTLSRVEQLVSPDPAADWR